jgi:hypothetical protein
MPVNQFLQKNSDFLPHPSQVPDAVQPRLGQSSTPAGAAPEAGRTLARLCEAVGTVQSRKHEDPTTNFAPPSCALYPREFQWR